MADTRHRILLALPWPPPSLLYGLCCRSHHGGRMKLSSRAICQAVFISKLSRYLGASRLGRIPLPGEESCQSDASSGLSTSSAAVRTQKTSVLQLDLSEKREAAWAWVLGMCVVVSLVHSLRCMCPIELGLISSHLHLHEVAVLPPPHSFVPLKANESWTETNIA